jgi:hypothetical protein
MILNSPYITGSITVTGNSVFEGSITVLGGISGSSAVSASYALSASFAATATSASFASNTATATSASQAQNAVSASFASNAATATSASFASNAATATSASQAQNAVSSSFAANANLLDGKDSTEFAITGSNIFTGIQYNTDSSNPNGFGASASIYTDGGIRITKDAYVSGTMFVNNLTVFGTQSVNYVTSSQLNISTNIISVNTDTPSIRFGGLSVYDSGSTGLTGSMLWDSERDHWVYSNPSGSSYSGGMLMSGPRASSLGNEQGTLNNFVMKGQGGDHITSSQIIDDGTTVRIPGNLQVTGSLSGSSAVFSSTLSATNLTAEGSPALGGIVSIRQDATYLAKGNGYSSIASSPSAFDFYGYTGASTYKNFTFIFSGLTNNTRRDYTLPDGSGTLALTGDLINYVTLGTNQSISGAKTFSSPLTGSSATFSSSVTATAGTFNLNTTDGGFKVVGVNATPTNLAYLANNYFPKFYTRNHNYGITIFDQSEATAIQSADLVNGNNARALILNPYGGNVLIGTTTDAGYKLDVNGTGRFSGALTVNGTRPILTDGSGGNIFIQGESGGWAVQYGFRGNAGTNRGGFGALGGTNDLSYWFIGKAYNDNALSLDYSTGAATFSSSVTATSYNVGDSNQTITKQNTSDLQLNAAAGGSNILFRVAGDERMRITSSGTVQPGANGTQDLGTSSLRWATVFTSDLSMSNGIGDYTIVEGEEDLFLYNNKTNKVFKFLLAEVDPSIAPPKKS